MRSIIFEVILLSLIYTSINAHLIARKVVEGIIEKHDHYWVIATDDTHVNRPTFPAYIRFYNLRTSARVYKVNCLDASRVMYYAPKREIIFLTSGHTWAEGESYYITLDEGVVYSGPDGNSSRISSPNFWQFSVVRSPYAKN